MATNGSIDKSGRKMDKTASLDDAMLLSGFGMYNILHMLMSGIILLGMIMQSLALGYILPAAQCDLELTLAQRGWLSAIPFLAIILTSFFWGWLADTQGRRPVMLFSMMISAIFSAFASFAPDVISFGVLVFLSAIFMSGSSAVVYTYLGEFNNLRHRDKMVAFGSSFVGIGTVILPCVSWLILPLEFAYPIPFLGIEYRPWRLLVVACALPFALASLLLMFAPESPKFLFATGHYEAAFSVVKRIYVRNTKMAEDTFPIKALIVESQTSKDTSIKGAAAIWQSMKEQTVPLFKSPLLPWTALTCFVQFGIFATTNGFYVWFPSILNSLANHEGGETKICDVLDAGRDAVSNGTMICDDTIHTSTFERSIYIGLVFSSMYIIVGFLVDYVGKKPILVVILGFTGISGICAHLAYNQQLAVILFAVFQMSGACIGLMNAVAVELFPTKYRAMAICLSMMMGRVGSMVGSNLIGLFLEVNCGAGFYLFGSIIISFGMYNILHMLMSGIILLGMIMQSLALGYILPAAQCDLELTLAQRGWLSAIPFLAIILTSFFWGWLADTQGRRPVMLFSMMISAIFSAFASFAPDVISFGVLVFLSAIFMSGSSAVVYTYLGEFNNLRHRDKMVAFGSSFVGIGTVILPCVSWLILPLEFAYPIPFLGIEYRPWRLLVVACALPFALASLLLMFAPESPKFLFATGHYEAAFSVVKRIYVRNTKMAEDTFPIKALIVESQTSKDTSIKGAAAIWQSMKEQTVPLFKSPLLPWTALTCFVQFGIFATTNGFYVWFPSILNSLANHEGGETKICDVLDAGRDAVSNGTMICDDTIHTSTFERSIYIGLVFSSMYIIVGFLVDYVGKKPILVVILGFTGISGICAHLAYNQQLAVILFAVFQMSGACIGLMNAVAVELFPTKYRAMAICLSMMMGRVGSMVGSNLIGLFLEVNCGAGFYLFGSIIIINSLFCLTLPNKKRIPHKKIVVESTQNETHEPV